MVDPPSRALPAADLGPALEAELATVPAQDVFLDPEELSERLHAIAGRDGGTVRTLGRSREGRPIECLTIGDGPLDAVVFGLPHPNEPIGGLTALHLADRLAAGGALGLAEAFRWHVVPCVDPDGLALNRGWLRGPYTLAHYARHFYRPAGDEQVEWTFPFHYKRAAFDDVLPETQALMGLIDGVQPTLMCSLHNSEFGGAYFYLSRREPALYGVLAALPGRFGVDLHAGEAEAPFIEVLSDGIHLWPGAEEGYDYTESLGLDPVAVPSGSASSTYAGRHGTLTVVSELPYWRDPRAGDTAPSGRRLDDALRCQATDVAEVVDLMTRGLASVSDAHVAASPLLRASAYFASALASVPASARRRADEATSRRVGSVAEIRSVEDLADSFRLRYAGMLRRGLESLPSPSHPVLDELAERHEAWLRRAEDRHTGLTVLPIGDLVAVQYGAILAAGHHLARPGGLPPSAL